LEFADDLDAFIDAEVQFEFSPGDHQSLHSATSHKIAIEEDADFARQQGEIGGIGHFGRQIHMLGKLGHCQILKMIPKIAVHDQQFGFATVARHIAAPARAENHGSCLGQLLPWRRIHPQPLPLLALRVPLLQRLAAPSIS
jgi:hypothetical protein